MPHESDNLEAVESVFQDIESLEHDNLIASRMDDYMEEDGAQKGNVDIIRDVDMFSGPSE